jgi:hypothetical protein
MAAELLDESQQIVQATIVGSSILVHLIVRPYDDRAGNGVVVLFGICELFGVLGADEDVTLQWIHLVLLIVAVLILVGFSISGAVGAVQEKRQQLRFGTSKQEHYNVSKTEGVMLVPLLSLLWLLLSPLLLMSFLLRSLVVKCRTDCSRHILTRLTKIFLWPVSLTLSAVQHSILGSVFNAIGLGAYMKKREEMSWFHIRDMDGYQTFGFPLSLKHPELLGKPLVVEQGECRINDSLVVKQIGYAKYSYCLPEVARPGDDIAIVFAHAPKHANKIVLHLLKDQRISVTFPEVAGPGGKLITKNYGIKYKYMYKNQKLPIIFEVPEVTISKPYPRKWNPTDVVEAGFLWNKLSWKEKWKFVNQSIDWGNYLGSKFNYRTDTKRDRCLP